MDDMDRFGGAVKGRRRWLDRMKVGRDLGGKGGSYGSEEVEWK